MAPRSSTRGDAVSLQSIGHGALALGFTSQFVLTDLFVRGRLGVRLHPEAIVGWLASIALWTLVVRTQHAGRGAQVARAVLAAFAVAVLVVDGLIFRYYGTLLDRQVLATAIHGWSDVRPILARLLPTAVAITVVVAVVEYACLRSVYTTARALPRRAFPALALLFIGSMCLLPASALTPELRAVHASSILLDASPAGTTGSVAEVPVTPSSRAEVPSILLILTESVGASSYCSEPAPACAFSPEVSALFPDRVPLNQMRSVASYTALSVSSLLTGRTLMDDARRGGAAPTLFDYVRAVRVDGRAPYVAYWSAQSKNVTERDAASSVDSLVTLESLLGHGLEDEDEAVADDMDRRLVERALAELAANRLPHPSFLMLHLLGTHAPYFVDPARAPFQPTAQVVSWAGLPALQNAYHDAVVQQDHTLAAFLRAFVALQSRDRAPFVILFTSDHGEAFGEHGAIHHGQNLYDEQIHVPGWVFASDGALDAVERANLAAHRDAFVTHLDLVPTVLDLLGVRESHALAPLRSSLAGRSLLVPTVARSPVPITNCTSMFPCPLDTWGMLGDGHALVAQPWDGDWNCVDLLTHAERTTDPACARLRDASRAFFPELPGGRTNRLEAR